MPSLSHRQLYSAVQHETNSIFWLKAERDRASQLINAKSTHLSNPSWCFPPSTIISTTALGTRHGSQHWQSLHPPAAPSVRVPNTPPHRPVRRPTAVSSRRFGRQARDDGETGTAEQPKLLDGAWQADSSQTRGRFKQQNPVTVPAFSHARPKWSPPLAMRRIAPERSRWQPQLAAVKRKTIRTTNASPARQRQPVDPAGRQPHATHPPIAPARTVPSAPSRSRPPSTTTAAACLSKTPSAAPPPPSLKPRSSSPPARQHSGPRERLPDRRGLGGWSWSSLRVLQFSSAAGASGPRPAGYADVGLARCPAAFADLQRAPLVRGPGAAGRRRCCSPFDSRVCGGLGAAVRWPWPACSGCVPNTSARRESQGRERGEGAGMLVGGRDGAMRTAGELAVYPRVCVVQGRLPGRLCSGQVRVGANLNSKHSSFRPTCVLCFCWWRVDL